MIKLPKPSFVRQKLEASSSSTAFLKAVQKSLKDILTGKDSRKIFIVGPCSIHDLEKDYEYASKLKELARDLEEVALVIMRVHVEKPRSKQGWKGFLYDPHLDSSHDMLTGIEKTREFLLDLATLGMPASMEILDPFAYKYYEDLLSYATIGARTSYSQIHRQIASDLKIPVGIKNSVEGRIEAAIHGICFARQPQTYISFNLEAEPIIHTSLGNPLCHLVLRGGQNAPNFGRHFIEEAISLLSTPIIIDCAHGNKIENDQGPAFRAAISYMQDGGLPIAGLMLESYLKEGAGLPSDKERSITDYCMSFESTKDLFSQYSLMGLNHI